MKRSSKLTFSIVVPAFNEEKYLGICLQSLKNQDFPKNDYEIIVVDNASTDKTAKIARKFKACLAGRQVQLIKEPKKGVVYARQAGFMNAKGKIICSTDSDCIVPKNWLKKINFSFNKNPHLVAVGGTFELINVDSFFKLIIKLSTPPGLFVDQFLRAGAGLYGPNLAIKKSVFVKIGGFDTSLIAGEDIEITKRLRPLGKIKNYASLKVKTSARRFNQGFRESFKYIVLNYIALNLFSKSYLKHFPDWR